jgi:hypothetical protein
MAFLKFKKYFFYNFLKKIHLILKFLIYGHIFFKFDFYFLVTYCLNSHFFLSLRDKCIDIISKVHMSPLFFYNSTINFNVIFIKFYYNMNNLKINNVNVEYDFTILRSFAI